MANSAHTRTHADAREQRRARTLAHTLAHSHSHAHAHAHPHATVSTCKHLYLLYAQCSRDILKLGDIWATDLSPLELQNAETKRVAESGGSKRLEFTAAGKTVVGMRGGKAGPMLLTQRKEYSTTLALSTLNNLLVTQKLRRGDGPIQYPQSRRAERLFGEEGRTANKTQEHAH